MSIPTKEKAAVRHIYRRVLALMAVLVLTTALAGVNPASASTCVVPTWQGPNGGSYVAVVMNYTVRSPLGYDQGIRSACAVVGLMPGSDPNGMWRIRIRVQDTDDRKYAGGGVWAWDDAGQARIQMLPTSWATWGEAYQITPGQYAGDWNSADFVYQDANGYRDYVTNWFSKSANGSPYSWGIRMVEQWHWQERNGSPWTWPEVTSVLWHIPAI